MAKWYVVRGDQERGPFEDAELKKLAASGKLKSDHQIRRDGSTTTRMAKEIKGLFPSNRHEQIDQKQIPPALPDSKATPTKPPTESASPQPQWTFSNLGKQLGTLGGIMLLLIWGVRGYRQLTAVTPKQASTVTSVNRGQVKKPLLAVPPTQTSVVTTSIFDATGNHRGGFLDSDGKVILEYRFDILSQFSDGLAPMKSKGKWGYIDKTGQFVIKPIYDKAEKFGDGLAFVSLNGKCLCIDKTGRTTFESQYPIEEIQPFSDGMFLIARFAKPPAPIQSSYGCGNRSGQVVIEPQYSQMSAFANGRAVVWIGTSPNDRSAIIDKRGRFVVGPSKKFIGCLTGGMNIGFSEGLIPFSDDQLLLDGYLDANGKETISASRCRSAYRDAGRFSDGLARITRGISKRAMFGTEPIPNDAGMVGYIDRTGKTVIDCQFKDGRDFSDGYAAVKWSGAEKWGYIDKNGQKIIEPDFDDAPGPFVNGKAVAQRGNLYGLIDTKGQFVVEPRFQRIGEFVDGMAWFEWP